jgi:hypothetical protein
VAGRFRVRAIVTAATVQISELEVHYDTVETSSCFEAKPETAQRMVEMRAGGPNRITGI